MKKLLSLLLALALCAGLGVPALAAAGFSDVAADSPFAPAIAWAVEQGVTKGTTPTTFGPGNTCTASHILTFLWRAAGRPGDAGEERAAVSAWASGLGIDVSDLSAPCTRAAAVTDIWKAQGSPAASEAASFTDVAPSAPYAGAVSWAVEAGVTNGTGGGAFSPEAVCTRGQIVTFLYRALAGSGAAEAPTAGADVLTNGKAITEDNVLEIMKQLEAKYPSGTSFGLGYTVAMKQKNGSITGTDVSDAVWSYERAEGGHTSVNAGCGGWAAFVSDSIFGTTGRPARKVDSLTARPGDIVIQLNSDNRLVHVAIMTKWDFSSGLAQISTTDADSQGTRQNSQYITTWNEYGYTATPSNAPTHIEVWTRYPLDGTPVTVPSSSTPSTPADSSGSGSSAAPATGPSIPDLGILDAPCGLCGKTGGGSVLNDAGTRKVCSDCHNHNRAAAIAYLNS